MPQKELTDISVKPAPHDSVPADSTGPAYYAPAFPDGLTDTLVLGGHTARQLTDYPVAASVTGKEPEYYQHTPVKTSGTLVLLMVSFLLVAFSYKKGWKYFTTILNNVWSVKRTENHLDDHTISETLVMTALILQTIIVEGIILFYAVEHFFPGSLSGNVSLGVAFTVASAGIYYILQLLIFHFLGYTFSNTKNTSLWTQGFNASQSLMGLLLTPVAVIMLFMPELNSLMLLLSVSLYAIARMAFLMKSFRIFFNKMFHLVYFILYLCGVEISLLLIFCKITIIISNLLEISPK